MAENTKILLDSAPRRLNDKVGSYITTRQFQENDLEKQGRTRTGFTGTVKYVRGGKI